jgi:Glycosyl transferase 4-like domain
VVPLSAAPVLRVAYVLGTTAGGTGPHVAMLARGCAGRGMAVRVFGPAESGRFFTASAAPDGPPGFVVVDVADRPRPAHDLAVMLRLRRLLRAWAPDVVHAHGLRAGSPRLPSPAGRVGAGRRGGGPRWLSPCTTPPWPGA